MDLETCMMEECMRKLALWHTRTFKPVMTHEELEPIMSTMGFIAQATGGGGFKEYVFLSSPTTTTRPRLPYPHIDGLHISTYQAFIDALAFFLDVSDLFHVRGMPLQRVKDKNRKWRRMEEDELSVFVYRDGTLDKSGHGRPSKEDSYIHVLIHLKPLPSSTLLPLKDIIVSV
ncbi:uncharacterized protein LOC9304910 [Arabidopsis lyrata subsp. lyrata]|uniref:uncharacterized protein LOC9304910 n=1 Tax=Arabidopsis lyrata subsp. lyrata TaxID=81972 RepID=UPI000A29C710|nr:uncharacterized protein LOC9304910 [Arabidopsis lyrata subsp. lyrata]|eukprot:XP_002868838.2 uncharacterized protein LOC9304910 [Arabidopsis lyrata subsp. lyrata]